jgi:hypothetical protein
LMALKGARQSLYRPGDDANRPRYLKPETYSLRPNV